jgi:hypothetical protein
MGNQLALISSQFLWIYPDPGQFQWQLSGNQAEKNPKNLNIGITSPEKLQFSVMQ